MKYYNTSGGFEERVVVTDDSTFFNNPNPVFDEESVADDALDRRFDRPQMGDPENRPKPIEGKPIIKEPAVTPPPSPAPFDPSLLGGILMTNTLNSMPDYYGQMQTITVFDEEDDFEESDIDEGFTDKEESKDTNPFEEELVTGESLTDFEEELVTGEGLTDKEESKDTGIVVVPQAGEASDLLEDLNIYTSETETGEGEKKKKDNNTLKMAVVGLVVLAIFASTKK